MNIDSLANITVYVTQRYFICLDIYLIYFCPPLGYFLTQEYAHTDTNPAYQSGESVVQCYCSWGFVIKGSQLCSVPCSFIDATIIVFLMSQTLVLL